MNQIPIRCEFGEFSRIWESNFIRIFSKLICEQNLFLLSALKNLGISFEESEIKFSFQFWRICELVLKNWFQKSAIKI
jgi:hypothetical protein